MKVYAVFTNEYADGWGCSYHCHGIFSTEELALAAKYKDEAGNIWPVGPQDICYIELDSKNVDEYIGGYSE